MSKRAPAKREPMPDYKSGARVYLTPSAKYLVEHGWTFSLSFNGRYWTEYYTREGVEGQMTLEHAVAKQRELSAAAEAKRQAEAWAARINRYREQLEAKGIQVPDTRLGPNARENANLEVTAKAKDLAEWLSFLEGHSVALQERDQNRRALMQRRGAVSAAPGNPEAQAARL